MKLLAITYLTMLSLSSRLVLGLRPSNIQNLGLKNMSKTQLQSSLSEGDLMFGKFRIPKESIFHRSKLSAAFVNLRPIVPGHVLIMPQRLVPLMEDMDSDEYTDLWITVRKVQAALKTKYSCDAFNIAVQDGRAAGQSVPHVHVHILPRTSGDLERNDDIYDSLQEWAPRDELKHEASLDVPEDVARKDRTPQQMAEEAASYKDFF